MAPAPTDCRHCGETLQETVAFCPFCGGVPQARAVPVPMAPLAAVPAPPVVAAPAAEPLASPRLRQPVVPPFRPVPPRVPPRWGTGGRRGPARRSGALVRLLAAGLLLLVGWLLWEHLVDAPQSSIVVTINGPAAGNVLVDDVAAGSPGQPIAVAPGRHRIGFDASGYRTPTLVVVVADGQRRSLTLSPVASPALLTLDSDPAGAVLAVDGHAVGRAPVTRHLGAGTYRVTATLPGFLATDRTIDLAPGSQANLVIPLEPVPLRTLHLEAPAGRWSDPVVPKPGGRFTLLFRAAVRVRIAGHVVLLRPGAPADLGAADGDGLSFTAVGDAAVPITLLIASTARADTP